MRIALALLVVAAVAALAWADPATGTVIVSCNEPDASLIIDGVLIPEHVPAVLTLPIGTHVIEAHKPSLVTQKQTIELAAQAQIKVRFELVAAVAPAPAPPAPAPPAPPTQSPQPPPPPVAAGSGTGTGSGSAAPISAGSGAPIVPVAAIVPASKPIAAPPIQHCSEGGHEIPCPPVGPHCTEGGKPVSCIRGLPPPRPPAPPAPPAPPQPALAPPSATPASAGAAPAIAAGSGAPAEPTLAPGLSLIEIATTAAHAIVYVDGAPVREAPCAIELEPGEHLVAVYAAGMVPAEAIVRAEAAHRQRIELIPTTQRRRTDVPSP